MTTLTATGCVTPDCHEVHSKSCKPNKWWVSSGEELKC